MTLPDLETLRLTRGGGGPGISCGIFTFQRGWHMQLGLGGEPQSSDPGLGRGGVLPPSSNGSAQICTWFLLALVLLTSGCGGSDSTAPTPSGPAISSLSILGSPVAAVGATGYQFIAVVQYSNLTS